MSFSFKKAFVPLLFFAASTLNVSNAAAASAPCPSCTLPQQEGVAISLGVGKHVVYDVPSRNLSTWWVLRDMETRQLYTYELGVTPLMLATFRFAVEAPIETYFSFTPGGPPDPRRPELGNPLGFGIDWTYTAYTVATDPLRRGRIEGRLSNWLDGGGGTDEISAIYRGIVQALSPNRYVYITVWYADGSRETYKIDKATTTAKYIPGSARDSNGNPLPDSSVNDPGSTIFEGTFDFVNQQSVDDWVALMEQQGVPVTGAPSRRVTCVRIPPGPWECTYH